LYVYVDNDAVFPIKTPPSYSHQVVPIDFLQTIVKTCIIHGTIPEKAGSDQTTY